MTTQNKLFLKSAEKRGLSYDAYLVVMAAQSTASAQDTVAAACFQAFNGGAQEATQESALGQALTYLVSERKNAGKSDTPEYKEADKAISAFQMQCTRWLNQCKSIKGSSYAYCVGSAESMKPKRISLAKGIVSLVTSSAPKTGAKTPAPKKESGKSGTTVKATLESLMEANDWDVQDVLHQLSQMKGHSYKNTILECGIFIEDAKKAQVK